MARNRFLQSQTMRASQAAPNVASGVAPSSTPSRGSAQRIAQACAQTASAATAKYAAPGARPEKGRERPPSAAQLGPNAGQEMGRPVLRSPRVCMAGAATGGRW
jgi:hypothetical protein